MKNQAFVEFQAIEQAIAIVTHYAQAPEPAKFRGRPTWLSYRCARFARQVLGDYACDRQPRGCPQTDMRLAYCCASSGSHMNF